MHSANSVFSGISHKRSSSLNEVLDEECESVQAAVKESTTVDESQPFRVPLTRCSAFPWSNVLLCALIIGVTLLLVSPVIVFYIPRDLLGLDEVRQVRKSMGKANTLSEVLCACGCEQNQNLCPIESPRLDL